MKETFSLLAVCVCVLLLSCAHIRDEPMEPLSHPTSRMLPPDIQAEGISKIRMPDLQPDWTPDWWHETVTPTFSGLPFPDVLALLSVGHPYVVDTRILNDWDPALGQSALPRPTPGTAPEGKDTKVEDRTPVPVDLLPDTLKTRGDVVNHLCNVYDYHCHHSPHMFYVDKFAVRSYVIHAQPGAMGGEMALRGLEESLGTTTVSMQYDAYGALDTIVSQVLKRSGERFIIVPDSNQVIVTARPSTHVLVREMVNEYNARMREVIEVQVSIFEITTLEDRGFSLTPAGIGFKEGLGGRVLDTVDLIIQNALVEQNINATYTTTSNSGSFSVAWAALSSIGKTKVIFDEKLETRNNIIVTTENTRHATFLKAINRVDTVATNTDRIETSFEIDFQDVRTGWSVGVQPTVAENGIITLRFALSRNNLVEVVPFRFGDAVSGNHFTTQQTNRLFTLTLKDGESRLITAMEADTTRDSGKFASRATKRERVEFAVLITARISTPESDNHI